MISSKRGQASLILILLAAIALILFAITVNWGSIAQIKTLTMTSSTTAAAGTASNYSSYGERLIQTNLQGQWQKCASNSIFLALITLLIVVILFVVGFACGGCSWPMVLGAPSLFLAAAAVVLATANLVLQIVVVQPGLTRLWNRLQSSNLPLVDQFMEQGLQAAIQGVVTDQAQITDYFDLNTNGHFGATVTPDDTISRFGFFYTERLKSIKRPDPTSIEPFLTALDAFIHGGGDESKALTKACTNMSDPHCNGCCLPLTDAMGSAVRPATNSIGTVCGTDTTPPGCANTAVWPHADTYPLAYDPTYPDYINGTSFLAKFGLDAEVKVFAQSDVQGAPQITPPPSPVSSGIYSFLWDMDTIQASPDPTPAAPDTRYSDKLGLPDGSGEIPHFKADPATCVTAADPHGFWWKKGADLYCSNTWPYDQCATSPTCNPADPATCGCTATTDPLDDVVYGLKQFDAWALKLLAQDHATLAAQLDRWYPQAATWIGPQCDGTNDLVCFDNQSEHNGGLLHSYSARLGYWKPMLDDWLAATTYSDANAWCVPPDDTGLSTYEKDAINAGGATWGGLQSVIQCLDYNSHNVDPAPDGAHRSFKACLDDVNALACPGSPAKPASCNDLPRSLVPGAEPAFDPCAVPTSNYRTWINDSYTKAVPQAAKFAARKTYLQNMKTKAQALSPLMANFKVQLDDFLNGPGVASLILARQNFNTLYLDKLPNLIIYGWRDQKPPKNGSRNEGYWHIVKAEANIPTTLPWIRTWTQGFLGMTRCYGLTADVGTTAVTVTRWDEDHDQSLYFANHIPLWKAVFHKPGTPELSTASLDSACAGSPSTDGSLVGWKAIGVNSSTVNALVSAGVDGSTAQNLSGGFMLNAQPGGGSSASTCWNTVTQLLGRGARTKTCAQYFGHVGNHMQIKFVPCS